MEPTGSSETDSYVQEKVGNEKGGIWRKDGLFYK